MHRVVADSEAVHCGPQTPPGPLADMGLDQEGDYEDHEVAELRSYDGPTAHVGPVAQIGEEEYNEKCEERAHCG